MNKQSEAMDHKPNPLREHLKPLVGEWDTLATHPQFAHAVHGHSSFQWLEGEALLMWHSVYKERPGPPQALAVIGWDDSLGSYQLLYSDERGVSRIYQTSLENGVWKFWRDAPGFEQRFTATFSADGSTLTGHGELRRDGTHWEGDLDVTFTKKGLTTTEKLDGSIQ